MASPRQFSVTGNSFCILQSVCISGVSKHVQVHLVQGCELLHRVLVQLAEVLPGQVAGAAPTTRVRSKVGKLDPCKLAQELLVLLEGLGLGDDHVGHVAVGTPGDEGLPVSVQVTLVDTPGNIKKQAGAELGQAQPKLGLDCN